MEKSRIFLVPYKRRNLTAVVRAELDEQGRPVSTKFLGIHHRTETDKHVLPASKGDIMAVPGLEKEVPVIHYYLRPSMSEEDGAQSADFISSVKKQILAKI